MLAKWFFNVRWSWWRLVFAAIVTVGLYSTYIRFTRGLGASTALRDTFPWGLWIGFDVLCGVALAAGGFTVSATVYVFHLDRFKPVVRPTILTAFLGYLLAILGLAYDLGHPYRIWHALIMWNPRSVMFEVAWCVMLYTTVLALEFSPILFERLRWERATRVAHGLTVPLVMLGVVLSMLHQSSLGSLFLILPSKHHPLWYSPWLPFFFFVSAVGLGCAMTIFESFLSFRVFGKRLEMHLLSDLGKALAVVLGFYLTLKIVDLSNRGALPKAFESSYEGRMFLVEMLLGVVTPLALLLITRVRSDQLGLFVAAGMTVLGTVMNRLNVATTGLESQAGAYFPAWTEVAVTAFIIALGFAGFGLAVRHLPVFPSAELAPSREMPAAHLPFVAAARQPFNLSKALAIGAAVLATLAAGGLAFSGIRTLQNRSDSPPKAKPMAQEMLPLEIRFAPGPKSPGTVAFAHTSHVDLEKPDCAVCHAGEFDLRNRLSQSSSAGARLHDVRLCGSCHDGERSFSVKEDCEICHGVEAPARGPGA
jgi:c(7)-type cytochrome triheme protein